MTEPWGGAGWRQKSCAASWASMLPGTRPTAAAFTSSWSWNSGPGLSWTGGRRQTTPGRWPIAPGNLTRARPVRRVAVIAPAGIGDTSVPHPGYQAARPHRPEHLHDLVHGPGTRQRSGDGGGEPGGPPDPGGFSSAGSKEILAINSGPAPQPPDLLVSTLISRLAWVVSGPGGGEEPAGLGAAVVGKPAPGKILLAPAPALPPQPGMWAARISWPFVSFWGWRHLRP